MDSTDRINLDIAKKLRSDETYRKAFFRAAVSDSIALQIKALRKAYEMKQAQLAAAADMKQSAISRLEQAEYSSWSFNTLVRIAEALHSRLIVEFRPIEQAIQEYEPGRAASTEYSEAKNVNTGFTIVPSPQTKRWQRSDPATGTSVSFRKLPSGNAMNDFRPIKAEEARHG